MDYILQMEKLFKFFEFNLELEQMHILLKIKRNFNNDLNLMGCFLKDYLAIQNSGTITQDENLYNDFVLFYAILYYLYYFRAFLKPFLLFRLKKCVFCIILIMR